MDCCCVDNVQLQPAWAHIWPFNCIRQVMPTTQDRASHIGMCANISRPVCSVLNRSVNSLDGHHTCTFFCLSLSDLWAFSYPTQLDMTKRVFAIGRMDETYGGRIRCCPLVSKFQYTTSATDRPNYAYPCMDVAAVKTFIAASICCYSKCCRQNVIYLY